jgi:hypothetical protein
LAVVSALNLASIQRVRTFWKKVPPKYLQKLELLEEHLSPLGGTVKSFLYFDIRKQPISYFCHFLIISQSGYRNYKKLLKEGSSLATIPYLGLFLREITHICDGNPKEVTKSEELKQTSSSSSKSESGQNKASSDKNEEDVEETDEDDTDGTQDDVKDSPHIISPKTQSQSTPTLHNWERVLLLGARLSEVICRLCLMCCIGYFEHEKWFHSGRQATLIRTLQFYQFTKVSYEISPPDNLISIISKLPFRNEVLRNPPNYILSLCIEVSS